LSPLLGSLSGGLALPGELLLGEWVFVWRERWVLSWIVERGEGREEVLWDWNA
jgi:hypothetical protein